MPQPRTEHWPRWAGVMLPSLITFVLVFVAGLPIHLPLFAAAAPALGLIAVYFWALNRPDLLPNSAVFAAGLLQDVLFGVPLGVFALAFLVARTVTVMARGSLAGRPIWIAWFGFALVSTAAMAIAWALISILSGALPAAAAVIASGLVPIGIYPLLAWPLVRIEKVIVEEARGL